MRSIMSENAIAISNLNDFVFCPASIFFHNLDVETAKIIFQDSAQLNGSIAHRSVDLGTYSTRSSVLQGITVYSEEYNLIGKIDVFDIQSGVLTERKKRIRTIYDGYIYQLYAQCLSLREMGYTIKQIRLYSMDDNRVYNIPLPEQDLQKLVSFQKLIEDMVAFQLDTFQQDNPDKCRHCIYEPLCSFSTLKEVYE